MDENIILARFGLDFSTLENDTVAIKKRLEELRSELKELKNSEEDTTRQQVHLETAIRALNREYNQNSRILQQKVKDNEEVLNTEDRLNDILNTQATTIEGLRSQNSQLNKIRNQLDINTQAEEIQRLNERLNQNNDLIRANSDNLTQQRMNVGNYGNSIKSVIVDLEAFGIKVPEAFKRGASGASQMGTGMQNLSKSLKAGITGIAGLTKASVAFMLTPIGAVITTLAVAILAVTTALNRSEEQTNKLKKAFAPFTAVINLVTKALADLGGKYIEHVIQRLELLEKMIDDVLGGIQWALEKLGFEKASESVSNFRETLAEAGAEAKELADAEAKLTQAQREAQLVQLQYRKQAEDLRQLRDDESLSIDERIQKNEELGALLKKQAEEELAIARLALQVADARIKKEGETTQALDARYEALTKIAEIEERINSQESEQLKNRTSLEKQATENDKRLAEERARRAKEASDRRARELEKQINDQITFMQEELSLLETQRGWKAKTLQEELQDFEDSYKKRIALLDFQLENGKISELAYSNEVIKITQEREQILAQIAIESAEEELRIFNKTQEQIQNSRDYLNAQEFEKRSKSLQDQLEAQRAFEEERLALGIISQTEYNEAIRQLDDEFEQNSKQLREEREANEREEAKLKRALEFEEKLIELREQNATEFELQRELANENFELEMADLNWQYEQRLISQEEYNLRSKRLEQDLADSKTAIRQAETAMYIELTRGMFGAVADLVDENSKVGKAIALAQAGINMYEGITADLKLGFPLSLVAIAKTTATGMAAIRNILNTKIPSAKGGGGAGAGLPSGVRSTGFRTSNADATIMNQFDNDGRGNDTEEISNAVAEGARRGTEEGMTNLSNNRNIMNSSTF